jgi:Icc-related predicted phosphoesterase
MPLFRRREGEQALDLYYASDIHGSTLLWRKFLGAASFYGVEALIMGGDLAGKAIVPVEKLPDGRYRSRFLGDERVARTEAELEEQIAAIRFNGFYAWVATPDEIAARMDDEAARDRLFDEVVEADVREWVELAERRANGAGVYVIAGNDDPWLIDDVLGSGDRVVLCDHRIVRVGGHELLSSSYANRTPWDSPRELDEDELYTRLRTLADQLEDPASAIFNLHVPPFDSGLDTAPELRDDLSVVYRGGQPATKPVGSTAVRQLIEEVQPLLGLHGHIHESRGEARIGRTLCINSGSEYNTGRLHGVVVRLGRDRVVSHQFVVG